jgi:hypothetical protein
MVLHELFGFCPCHSFLTRMKKIENEEKNDEYEYYEEGENEEKGDVEQNRNKY